MKEWIMNQLTNLNILTILIMIMFVTFLSKSNTQKLLKEQSQEFYKDIEEVKDEIWRAQGRQRN
jgi:C4-dicarboxylate transporter